MACDYKYNKAKIVLSTLFLLVNAFLLCDALLNDSNDNSKPSFKLWGNFRLKSAVRTYTDKGYHILSQIDESYSYDQKRARLEFRTTYGEGIFYSQPTSNTNNNRTINFGTFYLDAKQKSYLMFDMNDDMSCRESSVEQLLTYLNLNVPEIMSPSPEDDETIAPTYVVGPARILYFVMNNQDKFTRVGDDLMFEVRNIPLQLYSYDYVIGNNNKTNEKVQLKVYTRKNDGQQQLPDMIPFQVIVKYGSYVKTSTVVINYSGFELFDDMKSVSWDLANTAGSVSHKNSANLRGNIQLDRFTFEPVAGCSNSLAANGKSLDIFSQLNLVNKKRSRFSFKADIEISGFSVIKDTKPIFIKSFVAYDSALDSMVFDLGESKSGFNSDNRIVSDQKVSSANTFARKQVFNLKFGKMYHILERGTNNEDNDNKRRTFLDKVLDLSNQVNNGSNCDARTERTQCVVADIMLKEKLSMGQLLLGVDKFVYLGKARVRGINALVYETTQRVESSMLPIWLEQPMHYMSLEDNKSKLRVPGSLSMKNKSQGSIYSDDMRLYTVAYFSETISERITKNDETELLPSLLYMEIYMLDEKSLTLHGKQTVYVYDFAWDLNHQPPSGEPIKELFSLQDYCSNNLQSSNQYSLLQMLLEPSPEGEEASMKTNESMSLSIASLRDLSLLASIQETFELPATMVFDIQSKFVRPKGDETDNELLLVSFRLAKHYDTKVSMFYIGQGEPYLLYRGTRIQTIVRSFQACFMQAAHVRGASIYFGYDPLKKICSIDMEPVKTVQIDFKKGGGSSRREKPAAFVMFDKPEDTGSTDYEMEIYRTCSIYDNTLLSQSLKWLEGLDRRSGKVRLLGTELELKDGEDNTKDKKFKVKNIHLDQNCLKSPLAESEKVDNEQIKNSIVVNSDRLVGLGLVLDNLKVNRIVRPAKINKWSNKSEIIDGGSTVTITINNNGQQQQQQEEELTSAMTFEQCRTACLADFSCSSFSYCVLKGKAECVASRINFRGGNNLMMQKKLSDAKERASLEQMKKGSTVSVNVSEANSMDPITLTLIRHPNCQIVNKNYLDLYRKPERMKFIFSDRQVYPVNEQEDCAELCTKRNIEIIRKDLDYFGQELFNNNNGEDIFKKHQATVKQICKAFLYLDSVALLGASRDEELKEKLERNIIPTQGGAEQSKEMPGGYCIVGDQANIEESARMAEKLKLNDDTEQERLNYNNQVKWAIKFDVYFFKYEYFYEKQFGLRLLGSPMTMEQTSAYRRVLMEHFRSPAITGSREYTTTTATSDNNKANEENDDKSLSLIKSFVEAGENIQEIITSDESQCAKICFSQVYGPWPACRSFDITVELKPGGSGGYVYRCYLNSITLDEALGRQKFNLIEDGSSTDSKVNLIKERWHYEAHQSFARDESRLTETIQLNNLDQTIKQRQSRGRVFLLKLPGSFSLIGVSIMSIVSGVFLGIKAGQKLIKSSSKVNRLPQISVNEILSPIVISGAEDAEILVANSGHDDDDRDDDDIYNNSINKQARSKSIGRPPIEFMNQVDSEGKIREDFDDD